MAEHEVYIQNVEENEEAVSVTGSVDGRQCAAVIRKAVLPKTKAQKQQVYADALAADYHKRAAPTPSATALVGHYEE